MVPGEFKYIPVVYEFELWISGTDYISFVIRKRSNSAQTQTQIFTSKLMWYQFVQIKQTRPQINTLVLLNDN